MTLLQKNNLQILQLEEASGDVTYWIVKDFKEPKFNSIESTKSGSFTGVMVTDLMEKAVVQWYGMQPNQIVEAFIREFTSSKYDESNPEVQMKFSDSHTWKLVGS